ncbi:hypothetical protein [Paenibacillus pabuli]|uniref:hypothetical protein n=1 Tax=Paenibacillus pabuli TaxID=1472 RepID=UPI003CEF7367
MLIILAVIVVIGVVFLLIYNSRSSRKAAEARASKVAEEDKGPVLLHEDVAAAQKEDRNHAPVKHTADLEHGEHRPAEVHPMEEPMEKTHAAPHKEAQGTDGDQAYRQALLQFRKPTGTEVELPPADTSKEEKSADEVYRSALKAMKNKSDNTSSDRK